MDGLSHWLGRSETCNEASLISFDWSNEVFITTSIPSDMNDDISNSFSVSSHLVLLNGSIALILNYRKIDTFHIFHISILGELGVKESWTKLFIVGSLPCLEYPIGAGKKGDMLFRNKEGGLVWLDLNTQMIEDLGIIPVRSGCNIVIHKENLLPFVG
jgi:molecular chaperone HtpG